MVDLRFNRKNTRILLKGSAALGNYRLSLLRLDWLLEQDRMVGCICHRWFKDDIVFYIIKNDTEYRLVSLFDNYLLHNLRNQTASCEYTTYRRIHLIHTSQVRHKHLINF